MMMNLDIYRRRYKKTPGRVLEVALESSVKSYDRGDTIKGTDVAVSR